MSIPSSRSPQAEPAASKQHVDENKLPSGQCRYILLNPEIKGQRCACVGFTFNRSLPGVTCDCGHLSCYHIQSAEPPPDKNEVDTLRRRIKLLEEQLDRENDGGLGSALGTVVRRLGDLEEQVEKNRDETNLEVKGCYRNVDRMWQSVTQLENRTSGYEDRFLTFDERLDGHDDTLHGLGNRLMEFDEASMVLEERLDALEDQDSAGIPFRRRRRRSTSGSEDSKNDKRAVAWRRRPQGHRDHSAATHSSLTSVSDSRCEVPKIKPIEVRGSWTVHVSLLPTASQPFPFEKDTNAYKRCLSRGLHQMIAVEGTDGDSFVKAVTKAFGSLLRGRDWVPLRARLCDAETLQGLPMLRPLDPALIGMNYDLDFLRKYCAVCLPNGKVESMYIAMLSDTFSWQFLRRSPCYLDGLEECWAYDPLLDPVDNFEYCNGNLGDGRSAGEIVPPLPSLKRPASEMSRTPSLSSVSANEGNDNSRQKLPRTTCIQAAMELRRRGVETV
ncbi:uncharacterized protein GGS22DRAFT_192670 [Annulohypoxylon maeteangense]|uniref:uncharacterized protein n=1 Tax=Annulohypoxylon maeteangense TaxID=1927788 RepID=UPI0020087E87|nr:uncharacterized protein GGS22DRAFT_192670 [Annulohypoxylon maeteangense]KAI0881183.1 hypothetical protein GGS22DRAFT_192670 [Annulohypoxylon maeteangense]